MQYYCQKRRREHLLELGYILGLIWYHISLAVRQSFFSFQNNPKNPDPSYKMDLELWDCLGRVKLSLQQKFI